MNKKVTKKLEEMLDTDQRAIKDFKKGVISAKKLKLIHSDNIRFLQKTTKEYGFPYISQTSLRAYKAAFLTIQHSGKISLYKKTISLFKNKTKKDIVPGDIAFLIDRMNILQGRPQSFGTQFKVDKTGKIVFLPIKNVKDIDVRRSELGLESFVKYKKRVKKMIK